MGRFFDGDISGKFWFAVQASNDADFFGVQGIEPNYLEYYFTKDSDRQGINKGIKVCTKKLGKNKEKLDLFFKQHEGYNDKELAKYLKVSKNKTKELLIWYARLELGNKIKECVDEQGDCSFTAEL